MRRSLSNLLAATVLSAGTLLLVCGARLGGASVQAAATPGSLTIDYPLSGSIFPPEITAPTFLWHDTSAATAWAIEVSFRRPGDGMRFQSAGELLQPGKLDTRVGTNVEWTEEQRSTHTWKPEERDWARMKAGAARGPATVRILGYTGSGGEPVSEASLTISTSADAVGAPIFYRDVPLILAPMVGPGAIQPLPTFALPLIAWKLRDISQPASHTVMENVPTCANCHSFSRDGRTMGLDMDGPRNDKGLYALATVSPKMSITNREMIRWSAFSEGAGPVSSDPAVKRFGFMSQVSPDGRYVITSIAAPGTKNLHGAEAPGFAPGLINRLFSTNYQHLDFTQVFYPTGGILAWYDRSAKKLRPLPGADDPRFVQTSAFWSPDGKYLIYSRARAIDPYPAGAAKPTYANDPNEPLVQYDLYKIPFNGGRGGTAIPVAGASKNGMSNNFPKVSPDGRWIVFVENHTGLLMRPDSRLFMVPFGGGKARLMTCNTPRMNSWHSFSPNGRWMAFSSKGRSPFTQLMLTHIDADGHDSPAILVENTTAANRAVNIPEFLNISAGGLEEIDPQATEFYRLFDQAYNMIEENRFPEAIAAMRGALERDPEDALAHYGLATALSANDQEREALPEYRRACELNPKDPAWLDHFAVSLANNGQTAEAIVTWRKSLALQPKDPGAETDLGTTLFNSGNRQEGYAHLEKAVAMAPGFSEGHNRLGMAMQELGETAAGAEQLRKAIELQPDSVEYHFNLGYVLDAGGDPAAAIAPLEKAVQLSQGANWHCLAELAKAYDRSGRPAQAVTAESQALELAVRDHEDALAGNLRKLLERYQRDAAGAAGTAADAKH